uniref:Uncharacterized protein n=1 Tax=Oryza rufipogon TaxID=4529 RepID=A0A0E0R5A0_ORYRU
MRIKGCLETGGKSSAKSDDKKKKRVRAQVTCKKMKRQPRKNDRKYPPEPSTPIMITNRFTLTHDSLGMVTRRRLQCC